MAVGNRIDSGGLNTRLGSTAVLRLNAARSAEDLWEYVASLGADEAAQVAGLQALGFTAGDAADFWRLANYLHADAMIYYGQLARPDPFDTDTALAGARGPG